MKLVLIFILNKVEVKRNKRDICTVVLFLHPIMRNYWFLRLKTNPDIQPSKAHIQNTKYMFIYFNMTRNCTTTPQMH